MTHVPQWGQQQRLDGGGLQAMVAAATRLHAPALRDQRGPSCYALPTPLGGPFVPKGTAHRQKQMLHTLSKRRRRTTYKGYAAP